MTTYRGVSIDGTTVPVTSATINPARSLIIEQSFGSAGESKIYDGSMVVSGNFEGAYRADGLVEDAIVDIMSVMSNTTASLTPHALVIGDENGGVAFAVTVINSFELTLNVKDYTKVNLGFVTSSAGTSSSISATTSYATAIPVSTTSQITCTAAGTNFSGITIRGEIPIDQDYFVIGSKNLVALLQSGNGTLSGSLTLAASEWTGLLKAVGSCGNIGTIALTLNTTDSSTCASTVAATITITDVKIESASASGQGRARFEKTLNWKAEVNTTANNNILT
jgi:hypothetical protein